MKGEDVIQFMVNQFVGKMKRNYDSCTSLGNFNFGREVIFFFPPPLLPSYLPSLPPSLLHLFSFLFAVLDYAAINLQCSCINIIVVVLLFSPVLFLSIPCFLSSPDGQTNHYNLPVLIISLLKIPVLLQFSN